MTENHQDFEIENLEKGISHLKDCHNSLPLDASSSKEEISDFNQSQEESDLNALQEEEILGEHTFIQ